MKEDVQEEANTHSLLLFSGDLLGLWIINPARRLHFSLGLKDEKQNISNDSSQALLIADFHLSKRPFHVLIITAERLRPHEGHMHLTI